MSGSAQPSTIRGYLDSISTWNKYLRTHRSDTMALGQYDATLQNVSTRYPMPNSQVAFILVGFIDYLREQGLNVNTHLTGLL